jgi:hypothetical protein
MDSRPDEFIVGGNGFQTDKEGNTYINLCKEDSNWNQGRQYYGL